jgi:hypothetical protein
MRFGRDRETRGIDLADQFTKVRNETRAEPFGHGPPVRFVDVADGDKLRVF